MPILRPDKPVEKIDNLRPGLRPLAQGLRRLLWPYGPGPNTVDAGLPPSAPVLVAGDWGSGKSSVLWSIYNSINKRQPERSGAPAVWFEAWHYEATGPLLGALIHAVLAAAPPAYRQSLVCRRRLKQVCGLVTAVTGRAMLGYLTGGLLGPTPLDAEPVDASGTFEGTGARALAQDAEALVGATDQLAIDPVDRLRSAVRDLLRDIWGEAQPYPVVFIDDLDRCSPASLVELIDGLRLLVSDAEELRCRFVVALDRDVAVEALSHKFGGLSRFDGNRYLEKVFPLCLHVPKLSPNDVRLILSDFTSHHCAVPPAARAGAPRHPGPSTTLIDGDDNNTLTQVLSERVFANPRLIKRCIDRLAVLKQLESWSNGPAPENDRVTHLEEERALVQWLAASERWPLLRRIARSHGADFWEQLRRHLTDESGRSLIDPELRRLVDEPTFLEWVKNQGARRVPAFEAAEERLSRMGL